MAKLKGLTRKQTCKFVHYATLKFSFALIPKYVSNKNAVVSLCQRTNCIKGAG